MSVYVCVAMQCDACNTKPLLAPHTTILLSALTVVRNDNEMKTNKSETEHYTRRLQIENRWTGPTLPAWIQWQRRPYVFILCWWKVSSILYSCVYTSDNWYFLTLLFFSNFSFRFNSWRKKTKNKKKLDFPFYKRGAMIFTTFYNSTHYISESSIFTNVSCVYEHNIRSGSNNITAPRTPTISATHSYIHKHISRHWYIGAARLLFLHFFCIFLFSFRIIHSF